jgi:hypothetical protein
MQLLNAAIRHVKGWVLFSIFLLPLSFVGFWTLASGATNWLADYFNLMPGLAGLIVGGAALIPLVIAVLWHGGSRKHRAPKQHAADHHPDLPAQVKETIELVQSLTRTAPMAAVSLAVMAGFMLMRSPNLLPVVISAFAASKLDRV